MPEADANLYTRFKLKSEKLSKCKIGALGCVHLSKKKLYEIFEK